MEQREAKRAKMSKTDIVCKFFLDAVKNKVYGYKWQCINGDDCHYKHCLPKDYVIKSLQGKSEEDFTLDEFHDLEEKIDAERERISKNGTKVTEKTLFEWIERRKREKELDPSVSKKMEILKKLKTGRELFNDNKNDYKDDDNADDDIYVNQGNDIDEETKLLQDQLWGKEEVSVKVDTDLFKDEGNLDDVDLDEEIKEEAEGEGEEEKDENDEGN